MTGNPEAKLLVHAISGAGKTVFGGTALECPEMCPILMVDVEHQIRSIKSKVRDIEFDQITDPDPTRINRINIKTWRDMDKIYSWLFSKRSDSVKDIYNLVMIDSLTDITFLSLLEAQGKPGQPANLSMQSMPEIQHYGRSNYIIRQMVRGFRDMEGISVYYTTLVQPQEAIDTSLQMLKPGLPGKLAEEVPSLVEFNGYLSSDGNGRRKMQFEQRGKVYAKWRGEGKAPADITDPTFRKFLDLMQTH